MNSNLLYNFLNYNADVNDYRYLNNTDIVDQEFTVINNINENLLELVDKNNKSPIHLFDAKIYIDNIRKSYKSDRQKVLQFNLDAPRSKVFVNGDLINNFIELKLSLPSSYSEQMIFDIATLSSQTALAFPYTLSHHLYANTEKNVYVFSSDTPVITKIETFAKIFTVTITKQFDLRDITVNKLIKHISIELYLDYNDGFTNGVISIN